MAIQTDWSRRTALADWLTANGINPHDVPIDGDLLIEDTDDGRAIRYETFVRTETGAKVMDPRGRDAYETHSVPLKTKPPAWFEPYEKPTREQLLATVERVRALHHDWENDPGHCAHCTGPDGNLVPWPCPTAHALDGQEQPS
jgi:hypothetical protein